MRANPNAQAHILLGQEPRFVPGWLRRRYAARDGALRARVDAALEGVELLARGRQGGGALLHTSPNGMLWAGAAARPGLLPRLLREILETRFMVKRAMKQVGCPCLPQRPRPPSARSRA